MIFVAKLFSTNLDFFNATYKTGFMCFVFIEKLTQIYRFLSFLAVEEKTCTNCQMKITGKGGVDIGD